MDLMETPSSSQAKDLLCQKRQEVEYYEPDMKRLKYSTGIGTSPAVQEAFQREESLQESLQMGNSLPEIHRLMDPTWPTVRFNLTKASTVKYECQRRLQVDDCLLGFDAPLIDPPALVHPWESSVLTGEEIKIRIELPPTLCHLDLPPSANHLAEVLPWFNTGTTTLGFVYSEGIIVATDSRATAKGHIVSQKLNKVISVSSHILCTLAGNAADCVYWLRCLKKESEAHETKYGVRMRVVHAASLLVNMVRKYRSSNIVSQTQAGLSFGTLMASYDEESGPLLFMLDNTGLMLGGAKFCVGSGSEYAQAIVDSEYRSGMSEADACQLATSAIYHACRRDIHSGGYVRVYRIDREGWQEVYCRDVNEIYNESNVGSGDDRRL